MPVTIPGVKTLLADGYFSPADDAFGARRILIVAPANPVTASETPGYLAAEPTNELYNPTLYRNENDVVADFGLGSPVHVAYSQCLRAGGANIYISATAPHSVADAKSAPTGDYATYTQREYEVIQALANVDLVLPEIIVLHGYYINEYALQGTTHRVARFGEIVSQTCASLLADSYPCIGVIAPVGIEDHLNASRSADTHAAALVAETAATGGTTTTVVKAAAGWVADAYKGHFVRMKAGTASNIGEIRLITTNSATVLTVYPALPAACANLDTFEILEPARADKAELTYNPVRLTASNVNEYVGDLASKSAIANVDANWNWGVPLPLQFALDYVEGKTAADGPSLTRFLVVPVGELVTVGQPAEPDGDIAFQAAAPAVAGHIFGTKFNQAITMKRMQNCRYIRYRLSKSNLLSVIGVKACPVNVDSSLFIATIDGVTTAQDKAGEVSHFTRLQTLTICHEIVRGSRAIAEKFIGKTADENTLNSMETLLRSYFIDLKQMGAVRDIRFQIKFVYTEFKVYVDITVIPAGEIREVQLNVGVSLR